MTKLKYVGAKTDGERAFKEKTGIEWFPGTVENVPAALASEMLRHADVFALADDQTPAATSLASVSTAPVTGTSTSTGVPTGTDAPPPLPAWATRGIDIGLTDAQLEVIAQAGGPDTETGAKLWLDSAGKPFHTEPPPPTYVMKTADGMPRVLDGMDRDALQALAKELGVKVHVNTGVAKVSEALVAAFPFATA